MRRHRKAAEGGKREMVEFLVGTDHMVHCYEEMTCGTWAWVQELSWNYTRKTHTPL